MHPKDECVCGHRRSAHKDNFGACRHRHVPQCTGFELAKAFVVLTPRAMTLLMDLMETHEREQDHQPEVMAELYAAGFLSYIKDDKWIAATDEGRAYAKENGVSNDRTVQQKAPARNPYRDLGRDPDDPPF